MGKLFCKNLSHAVMIVLCFGLLAHTKGAEENGGICEVSMFRLLANPERYAGKFIVVAGILHYRFEDNCLYATSDSARNVDQKSAVIVDFSGTDKKSIEGKFHRRPSDFDSEWVRLSGTFQVPFDPDGLGAGCGVLSDVDFVQVKIAKSRR